MPSSGATYVIGVFRQYSTTRVIVRSEWQSEMFGLFDLVLSGSDFRNTNSRASLC